MTVHFIRLNLYFRPTFVGTLLRFRSLTNEFQVITDHDFVNIIIIDS